MQAVHLDMVDGMVVNLLKEKWTTFLRFRFYRRMVAFTLYFLIFMAALILRPGTDVYEGTVYVLSLSLSLSLSYLSTDPTHLLSAPIHLHPVIGYFHGKSIEQLY